MVIEKWQDFLDSVLRHVRDGSVPLSRVDDAVRRILAVKSAYGLFDKPRPAQRPHADSASFGSQDHREVAREAVRRSLVLLKNEAGTLPLTREARVLVAGKNADNVGHQCGGFTVAWEGTSGNDAVVGGTSIWHGIRTAAPGAELSVDGSAADPDRHDVAIVVIGEEPYAEGLGDVRRGDDVIVATGSRIRGSLKALKPYGSSLVLAERHPEDLALIQSIIARGIPVIAVLVSGRPLIINVELEACQAFVAAWLPGSEGQGVADVLFGSHDFSGSLPFAWPRDESEVGLPEAERQRTRFPLGYGLRYAV